MKSIISSKSEWTFSLTLVTMLVLGFAFAPAALAADGGPLPELSSTDQHKDDGYQLVAYPVVTANQPANAAAADTLTEIVTFLDSVDQAGNVMFYIRLKSGTASLARAADGTPEGADQAQTDEEEHLLHISDLTISFLDRNGVMITESDTALPISESTTVINDRNPQFPDGRNFVVTIAEADIPARARVMTVTLGADQFNDHNTTNPLQGVIGLGNQASVVHDPAKPNDINAILKVGDADVNSLMLRLINEDPDKPGVVSMVRVSDATTAGLGGAATGQFGGNPVSGPFQVKVTFTEEPDLTTNDDGTYKLDALPFHIEGDRAKITAIVKGAPTYVVPSNLEGNYPAATDIPGTTGSDKRYHPYLLTIDPKLAASDDVVIRVKSFNDRFIPAKTFTPPNNFALVSNRTVLRVPVLSTAVKKTDVEVTNKATEKNRTEKRGNEMFIPGGLLIPSNGYLVLVKGTEVTSHVRKVGQDKYKDNDNREKADNITDIDFKCNVVYSQNFPVIEADLGLFFQQGGTIELRYKDAPDSTTPKNKKTGYHGARKDADEGIALGSVVISEIMWGSGVVEGVNTQYIELYNPGDTDISIDQEEWVLRFDGPTPIRSSYFDRLVDTVSNDPDDGTYWVVPGSKEIHASALNPDASILTSMFRTFETERKSGAAVDTVIPGAAIPDGTAQASWMASPSRPVINIVGNARGTPGAATPYMAPTDPTPTTPTTPTTPPAPIAGAADIAISEIMYSVGRGNLPQWIELHNMSAAEVSLKGWNVEIENEGSSDLTITLGATTLDAGQAVLLVSKNGRNSGVSDDPNAKGDIRRVVNLKDLGVELGTNEKLLSLDGFTITLSPPPAAGSSVRKDGDIAGGEDWELAMMDGDRSSLIRKRMGTDKDGAYTDGTMRTNWHHTSSTGRYGTYYGHPSDMGTPGYVKAGPLPVELSMFYPARDRLTGQVVIRWETQSELNNAGYFIKRSQQKNGTFVVINPTMIAGAGTTSEKQSYTYTDTTAKPNIVYYYQIEDVSLDGKRATLTNAHRLRGHIGAHGKATTIWGELKQQ